MSFNEWLLAYCKMLDKKSLWKNDSSYLKCNPINSRVFQAFSEYVKSISLDYQCFSFSRKGNRNVTVTKLIVGLFESQEKKYVYSFYIYSVFPIFKLNLYRATQTPSSSFLLSSLN